MTIKFWPTKNLALVKVILVIDLLTLLQLLRSDDNPLPIIEGLLGSSKSESESESKNRKVGCVLPMAIWPLYATRFKKTIRL